MSGVFTLDGLRFISDQILDGGVGTLKTVAIGTGTTAAQTTDTTLEAEVYRQDESGDNVSIERVDDTGEIRVLISVAGGTEITAGTNITEFGVFADDANTTLVYRAIYTGKVIESGTRTLFALTLDPINA